MKKLIPVISEIVQITFAIFLASIGLKAFLIPNGFLDGGATGIAILISRVTDLNISVILLLVSIPFFVIGSFTVTRKILVKSLLSILGLALMIHFENFEPITDDKLIIVTFGGLFLGSGIGLAIRNGTVLDGSEILGIYVNDRFGLSIGSVIFGFNLILFTITALVISPEIAMYCILTYLITFKAIDFTIQGFENYVGLMIVSQKSNEIQNHFLDKIGQGITVYQGLMGYGKTGVKDTNDIIHIIVNRIDLNRINNIIEELDPDAFSIEFDVNQVRGGKIRRQLT